MFKEKGYDEFLAQKLRESREDIKNGKVLTFEESRAKTQALVERKAKELSEMEMRAYA
ncbi:hypothetical protein ACWIW6_09545 [Ursidibacter sp. B-7004-1]|uniref:hypothetical protein n=1 Tax=Ursidibacter arcticus TaxID=1524965 RepID=UPI0013C332FB|nr:hypothetical protein [Ursidibacter arcticus]